MNSIWQLFASLFFLQPLSTLHRCNVVFSLTTLRLVRKASAATVVLANVRDPQSLQCKIGSTCALILEKWEVIMGIAVFKLEILGSYQGNYNAFYLLLWSLVCFLGNIGIIVIEKSNDVFKIKIIGVINDKPVEHQLFNMNCSPIHNRQTIWQQRPWFLWILPQNNPLTKILEIFNSINLHSHFLRESCGFIQ